MVYFDDLWFTLTTYVLLHVEQFNARIQICLRLGCDCLKERGARMQDGSGTHGFVIYIPLLFPTRLQWVCGFSSTHVWWVARGVRMHSVRSCVYVFVCRSIPGARTGQCTHTQLVCCSICRFRPTAICLFSAPVCFADSVHACRSSLRNSTGDRQVPFCLF